MVLTSNIILYRLLTQRQASSIIIFQFHHRATFRVATKGAPIGERASNGGAFCCSSQKAPALTKGALIGGVFCFVKTKGARIGGKIYCEVTFM